MDARSLEVALPSAKRPKRQKIHKVWLDLLPADVCSRIVSMLPQPDEERGEPTDIKLASVSDIQSRAVAQAQHHAVSINNAKVFSILTPIISAWRRILEDDIRHIRIEYKVADEYDLPITNRLFDPAGCRHELLMLPSFEKATILCFPATLRLIVAARSLKRLELHYTERLVAFADTTIDVSHVLRACPLEELCLACDLCIKRSRPPCFTEREIRRLTNGPEWDTLRSLTIRSCTREIKQLVAGLSCFPKLEALRLERCVPEKFNVRASLAW